MRTDIDKIILEEGERASHLEERLLELVKPEIAAELQELAGDTEKDEESVELDQIVRNSKVLLDIITEQARARLIWQIVAGCFLIFAVMTSFVCFGFYMNRENQMEKLGRAEANIQRISNDFTQADQKTKTLESQLADSKAELKNTRSLLGSSSSDVKSLQNQLADTTQRLKALQNSNAEAVKQLNERLQKLSASRKN
jgi:peptidoglycan hydrolase CwlO-like protein